MLIVSFLKINIQKGAFRVLNALFCWQEIGFGCGVPDSFARSNMLSSLFLSLLAGFRSAESKSPLKD
jgi:hypothetical protein